MVELFVYTAAISNFLSNNELFLINSHEVASNMHELEYSAKYLFSLHKLIKLSQSGTRRKYWGVKFENSKFSKLNSFNTT